MSGASYSIICPTFEGETRLPSLLECLKSNFLNEINGIPELIFVVDGSLDASERILKNFALDFPAFNINVFVNQTNIGPGQSRNIGVEIATGDVVVFLDDDCRPMANWYASLVAAWESKEESVIGIGTYVVPTETESFNGKYCSFFSPIKPWPNSTGNNSLVGRVLSYYATQRRVSRDVAYLVGASMSIDRRSFISLGGFSSSLRMAATEEMHLCEKIRELHGNASLMVVDTFVMPHDFSDEFTNTLRRSFRYGLGSGKNFWRGSGDLSFNPGPLLILAQFIAFLSIYFVSGISTEYFSLKASLFLLFVILSYSFYVTRGGVAHKLSHIEKIKFGLAFLLCEIANLLGFFSALHRVLKFNRKLS